MPVTIEQVRLQTLALPGVEEGICHGTPAFYVRRKLLVRLREDGETLVIALPRAERDGLIEQYPDALSVTDHYRNYDYVLLSLPNANEGLLHRLIEGAWRMKAAKQQVFARDARQAAVPAKKEASGA